jgi:hypothetical protein
MLLKDLESINMTEKAIESIMDGPMACHKIDLGAALCILMLSLVSATGY